MIAYKTVRTFTKKIHHPTRLMQLGVRIKEIIMSIKLTNAALDEVGGGHIILRGVLSPETISSILIAPYQREVMPTSNLSALVETMRGPESSVPDIYLGSRGGEFMERAGAFYVQSPTYVVDGLQRMSAARKVHELGGTPHLGAMVFFGTTEKWEKDMFRKLNCLRSRVSPNIILRNMKEENPAINTIFTLCSDPTFVMKGRVAWHQRVARGELITAMTFLTVIAMLHSHVSPGRNKSLTYLPGSLEKIMNVIGKNTFRDNIKTFYEILDEAYGIRRIAFREAAVYMRATFLVCLAEIFAKYPEVFFDQNRRLIVDRTWRKKIGLFQIDDPNISKLASAGGSARDVLSTLLINHLNSGKRTKRLIEKSAILRPSDMEQVEDSELEYA